jgi:hypothetical protein
MANPTRPGRRDPLDINNIEARRLEDKDYSYLDNEARLKLYEFLGNQYTQDYKEIHQMFQDGKIAYEQYKSSVATLKEIRDYNTNKLGF